MVVEDEINFLGKILVKKLNSAMPIMPRTGAIFVPKEKPLTSCLMLESSFI